MTTEIVPFNFASVPAHLKNQDVSAATLALTGGGVSQGKNISIEGGVFRLISGGKEIAKNKNRDMNIVIVRPAQANNRVFYDPAVVYVKGQSVPPLCSSTDGVKPDAKVKSPQAASCAACPQNIAGSGTGDARACRFQRKLALVLDGDLEGDVYRMTLSATSVFGKGVGTSELPLEAYARMLASNGVSIDRMVTKMEFDTEASTPKLIFSPVRHLTEAEISIVAKQAETVEARTAVGEVGGTNTPKLPAAEPAPAIAVPVAPAKPKVKKAAPAPVVSEDVVTPNGFTASDEEEPVVVEPPVADVRQSRINNAISAWG